MVQIGAGGEWGDVTHVFYHVWFDYMILTLFLIGKNDFIVLKQNKTKHTLPPSLAQIHTTQ